MKTSRQLCGVSISRFVALLLVVFLSVAPAGKLAAQKRVPANRASKPDIATLIDNLQSATDDYDLALTGVDFLPVGGSWYRDAFRSWYVPHESNELRDIVALGASAVPALVSHLNDGRPTRNHDSFPGSIIVADEYDFNSRTNHVRPTGVNKTTDSTIHNHIVTVGDLCFVALGQIVNRNFSAVRSQPTACLMINSPTSSTALRAAIVKEWSRPASPEKHEASLIQDFVNPDNWHRLEGACIRLGYYYPKALPPLALKQLSTPTYDAVSVYNLVHDQLYATLDPKKRKIEFDSYVVKHGKTARTGILEQLFEDLTEQEEDEAGRIFPSLKGTFHSRECLNQFFGYLKSVTSKQDPRLYPLDDHQHEISFIDLDIFQTLRYEPIIRKIPSFYQRCRPCHSLRHDYLTYSGKEVSAEIRQYVNERKPGASVSYIAELQKLYDRIGWTPLHVAIKNDEVERATTMVRNGADVNARAANGQTPLHIAAARGDLGAVQALLGWKADPGKTDNAGMTPMKLAVNVDSPWTVLALAAAGATPSTLPEATFADRADLVDIFLRKHPASVNKWPQSSETPLHQAAILGYVDVVKALLAHGANVDARDSTEYTPLHEAVRYHHPDVVKVLVEHNADRKAKSSDGKTALDYAKDAFIYTRDATDQKTISLLSQ